MQEFITYDDYRFLAGDKIVTTQSTVLSFAGNAVELDLTNESIKEILEIPIIRDLFRIGRPLAQSRKRTLKESQAYYQGMRAYAAEHGIEIKKNRDGTYLYPHSLRQAYLQHLASQDGSQA